MRSVVNAQNVQVLIINLDKIDSGIRSDTSHAFKEENCSIAWKNDRLWAIFSRLETELGLTDGNLMGRYESHVLSSKRTHEDKLATILMFADIYLP